MRSKLLLALFASAAVQAPARADILNAGDTLCIEFTVSNNLSPPPDVLTLNFGVIQVNQAFTARNAALYDGAALLGIDSETSFGSHVGALSMNSSNGFVEARSLWTFSSPTVVDFTTIANGSIQGRIEFTISTGQVDIPLNQVALRLAKETSSSGSSTVTPAPTLTSVSINTGGGCSGGTIGTAYCLGDSTSAGCPCGNPGGAGEGCANSTGSGATLAASGSTVAANSDVTFAAANLIPGQPALLFAGNNAVNGGFGAPFGDGLRCAGTNVVRLGVRFANAVGDASWGPSLGVGQWSAGDTRRYQAWYRNPVGGPCGTGYNLSNGGEITFN